MLFALLKVLNISSTGMRVAFDPNLNGRCRRQSKEKYALSLRSQLRPRSVPFSTRGDVVMGCAERAWMRALPWMPPGSSP